jgi:hypothetical protein
MAPLLPWEEGEMRARVLEAAAASRQRSPEDTDTASAVVPLRLAAIAAALLALLAGVLWISSTRRSEEARPDGALARTGPAEIEAPRSRPAPDVSAAPAAAPARRHAEPAAGPPAPPRGPAEAAAVPDRDVPSPAAAAATVPAAPSEVASASPRRVRRLAFESPAGTRIYWILDSGLPDLDGHSNGEPDVTGR